MNRLKFIPFGDMDRIHASEEERSFFENPLIPWWTKVVHVLRPGGRKGVRKEVWCKRCGRKHSKDDVCAMHLERDLTAPSTKLNDHGEPIPNTPVGFYTTRKD